MIKAARGETPVDLLLTHARIINVFSGEIISDNIAVANGYIVGLGSYRAEKTIDLKGRFVAPGFIDAHVHIESSMVGVTEFVRAVVVHGTTTVVADPHEIANVLGTEGINYMLRSAIRQPINIYLTFPSCVPATNLETAGASLDTDDLLAFIDKDHIIALAEMMNYPGVIHGDSEVLTKIEQTRMQRKRVDGHAPGLSGRDLSAYIAAGISSDHECTTAKEAMEKLRNGMYIMIREGTGARNLQALLPIINRQTARRIMWCTDDRHPHDLLQKGHIDSIIHEAVDAGIDPVTAIQMATINPAEYFGIHDIGAVAPGRRADLVVFSDLKNLKVEQVFCRGLKVAENQNILPQVEKPVLVKIEPSMNVKGNMLDFLIPAEKDYIRVIEIVSGQILTRQKVVRASISENFAVADPSLDLLKLAVVERHKGSGNIGKAFVKGFGLQQGALASSVTHDSHNIIVVGTNDADMKVAVEAVIKMKGGLAAACRQEIQARLPLPIAGLMSEDTVESVRDQLDNLIRVAHSLGVMLKDPFMTLSFLALPVIPELKLTDKGLVDVSRFEIVSLFVS